MRGAPRAGAGLPAARRARARPGPRFRGHLPYPGGRGSRRGRPAAHLGIAGAERGVNELGFPAASKAVAGGGPHHRAAAGAGAEPGRASGSSWPGLESRAPAEVVVEHLASVARRLAPSLLGLQDVQAAARGARGPLPRARAPGAGEGAAPGAHRRAPPSPPRGVSASATSGACWRRSLRRRWRAMPRCSPSGVARRSPGRSATSHAPCGALFAWLVDPALEETLRTRTVDGAPALEPERVQAHARGRVRAGRGRARGAPRVGRLRRPLRALCEGAFPEVAVLAYAELDPALRVKPLGRLSA